MGELRYPHFICKGLLESGILRSFFWLPRIRYVQMKKDMQAFLIFQPFSYLDGQIPPASPNASSRAGMLSISTIRGDCCLRDEKSLILVEPRAFVGRNMGSDYSLAG